MKIITTVTVGIERADGSYTKTTERHETHAGDNPRLEAAETTKAVAGAVAAINRRIADRSEA